MRMHSMDTRCVLAVLLSSVAATLGQHTSTSGSGNYYNGNSYYYGSYYNYYYGNSYNNGGPTTPSSPTSALAGGIVGAVVLLYIICGCTTLICCMCRRRSRFVSVAMRQQVGNQQTATDMYLQRYQRQYTTAAPPLINVFAYSSFQGDFTQDVRQIPFQGNISMHNPVGNIVTFAMTGADIYGSWSTERASISVTAAGDVDVCFIKRYNGEATYNIFCEATGSVAGVAPDGPINLRGSWTIFGESAGPRFLSLYANTAGSLSWQGQGEPVLGVPVQFATPM